MARSKTRGSLLWRKWLETSRKRPARIVLIEADRKTSWTAQALAEKASTFDSQLSEFKAGTKIAFRLANGADWLAVFLALQRAGLAAIPLDAAQPFDGCLNLARRLGARALFFGTDFHPLEGRSSPRDVCCIKVTSGSDGTPKPVPCRAEHLLADGRHVIETMKIRATDRNLAVIPMGHSYGLGNLVMPLIQQGTGIVTAGDYVPRQLVEWIHAHRITVLPAVPPLLRVLAALPPGPNLGRVRTVISAGARLNPAVAQAFFQRFGLKIHNFYGSSETGGITYDRTGNASLTGRSVGKPLTGVSIRLKKGRITVNSKAVASPGGRWLLGDVAEWNAKGELVLLGRLGQEANIGGKKVHPREIELILRALPDVTDAAVWLEQESGRDLLAAAVEAPCSRRELEQALAGQLPPWKVPKKFFIARELPRTNRGKLDGPELKRRAA